MKKILTDIRDLIASQIDLRNIRDNWGIWQHNQKGKSHFYTYQRTIAAAAETYILDFPVSMQLNHIRMTWDDSTAKDYDIRIYNDPSSPYYVSLNKKIGNISTTTFQQGGIEYKFEGGSRISVVITNATPTKIVRLVVQLDEL